MDAYTPLEDYTPTYPPSHSLILIDLLPSTHLDSPPSHSLILTQAQCIRMFSTSSHLHDCICRLARLTIVMTISTHPSPLDIVWMQSYIHSCQEHVLLTDVLTHNTPSSHHYDHHTLIHTHHLVWLAITPSSYSYTHTLTIIIHLHVLMMISSHLAISLITYCNAWHSRMLRHISAQRIKTINKSIANTRSTCLSILTT